MKRRYRGFFSMIATLLFALIILGAGYSGIAIGGEEILKISQDPERVTASEESSNLFYSRIEDDVQLHPWNYYSREHPLDQEISAETELEDRVNYLYMLIALAADVEVQEVIRWYDSQDKTILKDVVSRYVEEEENYYFFYDDVIRLNGREYHVKFCSDLSDLYSFSCLRPKAANIRDSEEWGEKKEELGEMMNKNSETMAALYKMMHTLRWQGVDVFAWGIDVEMYLLLDDQFSEIQNEGMRMEDIINDLSNQSTYRVIMGEMDAETQEIIQKEIIQKETMLKEWGETDFELQMVELDDCILLMNELYSTPAIYYDVISQKVVGFHFFS